MMAKLLEIPRLQGPFVRSMHGHPSCYKWIDADGVQHDIHQHEGGEQGDPLWSCSTLTIQFWPILVVSGLANLGQFNLGQSIFVGGGGVHNFRLCPRSGCSLGPPSPGPPSAGPPSDRPPSAGPPKISLFFPSRYPILICGFFFASLIFSMFVPHNEFWPILGRSPLSQLLETLFWSKRRPKILNFYPTRNFGHFWAALSKMSLNFSKFLGRLHTVSIVSCVFLLSLPLCLAPFFVSRRTLFAARCARFGMVASTNGHWIL